MAPLHDSLVALLQPDLVTEVGRAFRNSYLLAVRRHGVDSGGPTDAACRSAQLRVRRRKHWPSMRARPGPRVPVRREGLLAVDLPPIPCGDRAAGHGSVNFSEPWSREAKMVLPSSDPPLHPSVIWGPALGYAVVAGMAEAMGGKDTAATALALFDRLRLRDAFARAFSVGGEITEDGWRAAARVRLAFLVQTLTAVKPAKSGRSLRRPATRILGRWRCALATECARVGRRVVLQQGATSADLVVVAVARAAYRVRLQPRRTGQSGEKARPAASRSTQSIKTIEQRVQDAFEQAEEAGFRSERRRKRRQTRETRKRCAGKVRAAS